MSTKGLRTKQASLLKIADIRRVDRRSFRRFGLHGTDFAIRNAANDGSPYQSRGCRARCAKNLTEDLHRGVRVGVDDDISLQ
jgi:hypothetical protein